MECLVIAIVIVAMFVLGWLGLGYSFGGGQMQRTLRAVASQFQGRMRGGFFSEKSVEFVAEGRVVCEFVSVQGRWWLEVRFPNSILPMVGRMVSLPNRRAPVPPLQGFAYFTRFRDGDGNEHVLYHQEQNDGYQLLSDGVRQQMGLLRQMPFNGPVEVALADRLLIIRKSWGTMLPDHAIRFIRQALNFRDQLTLIGTGAISFVGETFPLQFDQATCQVCGEAIEQTTIVLCARCRTPHHQDCWSYGEGCSVYGCGGKDSLPVRS